MVVGDEVLPDPELVSGSKLEAMWSYPSSLQSRVRHPEIPEILEIA